MSGHKLANPYVAATFSHNQTAMKKALINCQAATLLVLQWSKGLFALCLVMLGLLWHAAVLAQTDAAGRVMFVVGKASKHTLNGPEQEITKDMIVRQGDKLVTAADAYVYTRMADGALLVVRPASTLSIDLWRYDAVKPEQSQIKYTLHNGLSRYVSGRGSQAAKDQFRFNTPLAAIGVRGTDFTVWSQPEVTEVAVRAGGVVMSAFGSNCQKEALGPCEGRSATELFASSGPGFLQLKSGEKQPQLIPLNGKVGPDQNSPALINEPSAKEDKSGSATNGMLALKIENRVEKMAAQLNAEAVTQMQAAQVVPVPPPLAVWGRWGGLATNAERDQIVASLLNGREVAAINSYYILASKPGMQTTLPETGTGNFKLTEHDGIVINPQTGKAESTRVLDGSLRIDFGKQRFQTDLKLEALGQMLQIGAAGKVEPGGILRSDLFVSPTTVQGLVGGEGAGQASYIYRQPGTNGLDISGATHWNR